MTALVIVALLFGAPKAKPPKLSVEIIGVPRFANAPLRVTCTLLVRDPERLVHCPSEISWAWSWNGEPMGSRLAPLPKCDPYELPEDVPTRWVERQQLKLSMPGVWVIGACMRGRFAMPCTTFMVELR